MRPPCRFSTRDAARRRRDTPGRSRATICWSHVRRGFIELAKGKTAPIAAEMLQRIAALYAIEATVRGKPPDIRRAVRQERSRPLVEDLFAWLPVQLARLPGSSPTAEATRYALNHREGLVRFLDDGRIELDTNTVERAIRPICLSRKNALFASGDDGGARWAAVASLVETCKLNGVDPQRYFTDVLTRLVNGWPNSRINELMPWRWAADEDGPASSQGRKTEIMRRTGKAKTAVWRWQERFMRAGVDGLLWEGQDPTIARPAPTCGNGGAGRGADPGRATRGDDALNGRRHGRGGRHQRQFSSAHLALARVAAAPHVSLQALE